MPVKSYQLTAMPQLQDKAQARLQQTQGRLTHVVDELLLSAGDDIRAPQQQPCVDQRQGQQQTIEALGLAYVGEFQAKAPAGVFGWCIILVDHLHSTGRVPTDSRGSPTKLQHYRFF